MVSCGGVGGAGDRGRRDRGVTKVKMGEREGGGGGRSEVFFFFKQKTAYEIGTGDWSSDVCSSDLTHLTGSRLICK